MSGGPAVASLPTSVEELRALVVELWEANAGLREVIAAQEQRIAELERRLGKDLDLEQAAVLGLALPQAGAAVVAQVFGAPAG